MRALPVDGFRLVARDGRAGAIGGTRFDVLIERAQPERSYADIERLLIEAPLEPGVRELSRRMFRRLAEAESEVHRVSIDAVHFHEVGAIDAIVDIVAAAAGLSYLGASVLASPLPMGRGSVRCQHGLLPLPAPATLLCLRGVPTYDAGIDAELVTPTGAAIVASVSEAYVRWPALAPERVGYGCGTLKLPDRPNALRVVLGVAAAPGPAEHASHVLLEANVDDMTGEVAAYAIERLLDAGALDAWAVPITMKKGRPALTLAVLAPAERANLLAAALLEQTTSLGVRRTPLSRDERPRRVVTVSTAYGQIPVKVAEGPYGAAQVKPEFDACAEAARRAGVALREVIHAALIAYENQRTG